MNESMFLPKSRDYSRRIMNPDIFLLKSTKLVVDSQRKNAETGSRTIKGNLQYGGFVLGNKHTGLGQFREKNSSLGRCMVDHRRFDTFIFFTQIKSTNVMLPTFNLVPTMTLFIFVAASVPQFALAKQELKAGSSSSRRRYDSIR
eukprot:scaffold60426_cov43-Attheya_sp.AAC.2